MEDKVMAYGSSIQNAIKIHTKKEVKHSNVHADSDYWVFEDGDYYMVAVYGAAVWIDKRDVVGG
jgi:hypothetical protein